MKTQTLLKFTNLSDIEPFNLTLAWEKDKDRHVLASYF